MHIRIFCARLVGCLLLISAIGMQNPAFADDDINDTPSGTLYLRRSAQAPVIEALRLATHMHVQVTGNVARVRRSRSLLATRPARLWMRWPSCPRPTLP
jgi:hypothetical protein